MFERLSDRGRQVVVLAQEEARGLNHNHIGTEHFLLGALRDSQSVTALALASWGVSLEDARHHVEAVSSKGEVPSDSHLPFTARGKKALELSLREALRLQHNHVGDGHIMLGVLHEGEGAAVQVLENLGVEPADLREAITELLGSDQGEFTPEGANTEVRTSAGIEVSVELELGSGDGPRCGRCSALTVDNLRVRTVRVPRAGRDSPDSVTLVWCGTCGAVFGATPDPNP
jgi:ATP-dependent Clp protease ATP-binding subunit ClpC